MIAAAAFLVALAGPATVQAQDLQEILDAASGEPVAVLWTLSDQAAALSRDAGSLARAAEGAPSPEGRFVCARALILQDAAPEAREALRVVFDEPASGLRGAVCGLLSDPLFRGDSDAQTWLLEILNQSGLDPTVKVTAAVALYRNGDGPSRRRAKREMKAMMGSRLGTLREHAALALAEVGDVEGARTVLKTMAGRPTADGRLARAFLEREELSRFHETKVRALETFYQREAASAPSTDAADPGSLSVLEEILEIIRQGHLEGETFTREELIAAAARGMLLAVDAHSTYFDGATFEKWFIRDLEAHYGGIGAYVRKEEGRFLILRPIYSGPAFEVGLLSGDHVWKVDGWETTEQSEEAIIQRLKGRPGTVVRVTIVREGLPEPFDVDIARARISIPSLNHEMLPGGIGYIEITRFSQETRPQLVAALADLTERGMKGLTIDLRNNAGGLLETAVAVVEAFLPPGLLAVTTRSRFRNDETYRTSQPALVDEDLPVMVMINRHTASAAEIVAGALQDHDRALLVGERSFGKGSVQRLLTLRTLPDESFIDTNDNGRRDDWENPVPDRNENGRYDYGPRVKLTVAEYLLPSGRSIHKRRDRDGAVVDPGGVEPDVVIEDRVGNFWEIQELNRLTGEGVFDSYFEEHFDTHSSLFLELAEADGRDPARYPGFDAFYGSLDTPLEVDAVRRHLRWILRRVKVVDARGKVFPADGQRGDWQEDPVLREAIRLIAEEADIEVASLPRED